MKNKVLIAIVSAFLMCGHGAAQAAVGLEKVNPEPQNVTGQVFNNVYTTDNGGVATLPGTSVTTETATPDVADTGAGSVGTESVGTGTPLAIEGGDGATLQEIGDSGNSAANAAGNVNASSLPNTGEQMSVNTSGTTGSSLLKSLAAGAAGLAAGAAGYQPDPATVESSLTNPDAVKVMKSGMVDRKDCARMVDSSRWRTEHRSQSQVEIIAREGTLPSTESLSCTAASQAIMANAFMDIFQSRGMQNKIFGLIGKDASKFFRDIGMPEGLGMQLIAQLGNTLVKALGIDKAVNELANKALGAVGDALGVGLSLGPSHINVSANDCKMMEKFSKPPCILSATSPIRRKDSDGTSTKCIDYAVLGLAVGIASGDMSGIKAGLWNAVGGALSSGLTSINNRIDASRAQSAADNATSGKTGP